MKRLILLSIVCISFSCTVEPINEPDTPIIQEVVADVQETTLQGTYRRSIGSQFEVYEVADMLRVYIQTNDSMDKIFEAEYSYTETDIIIDGNVYPYEISVDSVVICGYTYYRF